MDQLPPGQVAQILREVAQCTDSNFELNPFALKDRARVLEREEAARRVGEAKQEPFRPCPECINPGTCDRIGCYQATNASAATPPETPRRSAAHIPPFDWADYANGGDGLGAATPPEATTTGEDILRSVREIIGHEEREGKATPPAADALKARVVELEAALRAIAWSNDSKWQQDAAKHALKGAASG